MDERPKSGWELLEILSVDGCLEEDNFIVRKAIKWNVEGEILYQPIREYKEVING